MTIPDEILETVRERTAWRDFALCAVLGNALFFPEASAEHVSDRSTEKTRLAIEDIEVAVSICEKCPVRQDCFEFCATESYTWRYGIWGGTTHTQRRKWSRVNVLQGKVDVTKVRFRPPGRPKAKALTG